MDPTDGQSVKQQDLIVSSWMGDPMVSGCQVQNLLLMFLKILVPIFCVSMEMCSMGIEEVCS